jgi:outer membrane protein assembly factor BamD (BamD/ComL family)
VKLSVTTDFPALAAALRAALCAAALLVAPSALPDGTFPVDHLALANAAIADGMYPSAEQHLVKYLALNRAKSTSPEYRNALSLLCQTLAGLRRYDDIASLLDRNADIIDAGDRRIFDYWRAYSILENGNPMNALRLIDPDARIAATTNDTVNLQLVRLAADAYSRLDQPNALARAEEMIGFFLLNAPQTAPTLPLSGAKLLQAQLMARGGKRDTATATFKTLADDKSIDAFIRASAIREYVRLAETNALTAIEYANRLSRLPLGKAASDYVIPCGRILASRRDTAEAGARYLTRAVRENPASPLAPEAQLAIAEAWLSTGSNTLAAAEFKNYLETYGTTREETSRATAGRAEALFRLGEFSEAATLFQKAADTPSDLARSVLDMRAADALHAEGKYEAAAALYYDISCRAHTMTGHGYGDRLLKSLYSDAAAKGGVGFIQDRAHFMEADSLERCGKTEEALKRFDGIASAKTTGPKKLFSDEALYRAALLHERQGAGVGSTQEAITRYARLAAETTNDLLRCRALLGSGRCHYRHKSLEIAIRDLAKAEMGGYDFADEATMYHVYALYGLGRDTAAVNLAKAFVERESSSPVRPTLAFWLAQYYYNVMDFKESARRFTEFTANWPEDPRAPRALLWSAKADLRQSENQSALDTLAALGNGYGESEVMPEARYTQAKALCNLARFEEAVTLIDNSTSKFPESAFTTRALILKGDAIFSLYGTAKSVYSITNALSAYEIAGGRADATAETRLECNYKSARCLEKGGNAESVAQYYYDNVIAPFYTLANNGDVSPQGISFYEKAVFACARLNEQAGLPEKALSHLRRLVEYNTPERAQAEREITRIENGKE